jgi:hypothetical protein
MSTRARVHTPAFTPAFILHQFLSVFTTRTSCFPSFPVSLNANADTLSPVTVQNVSAPAALNPCNEQFPPTIAIGVGTCASSPNASAFTPSGTSLKKTSEFSSTSYPCSDVDDPISSISRFRRFASILVLPSRSPHANALIVRFKLIVRVSCSELAPRV